MSAADFNRLLQKADPDRRMAALFARPELRDRLLALYAFNHEIARIADATSESLIGEMKLTWWRDAIADLYADDPNVRRHDVTEALARETGRLDLEILQGLVQARFDDISARPFTGLDDVLAYVDATAGAIMRSALILAETELDEDWVRDAGRAWGLTGLLRAFAHRARIGRAPVGGDALAKVEATPAMMAQGLGSEKIAEARAATIAAAEEACDALQARGPLPAEAVPAMGYAVLAPAYLKALPTDPYAIAPERSLLARQARLTWLSLTGR